MMSEMKVGTRLALGFGAMVAVLLVVGGMGIANIMTLNHEVSLIARDRMPKLLAAFEVENKVNMQGRAFRNAIIYKETNAIKKELSRIPQSRTVIAEKLKFLEEQTSSETGKRLLAEVLKYNAAYAKETELLLNDLGTR